MIAGFLYCIHSWEVEGRLRRGGGIGRVGIRRYDRI